MTVSIPVLSAVLVGSPDVALDLIQDRGDMVLDDVAVPHVQGSIDIHLPGAYTTVGGIPTWVPNATTYALLDPRLTKRIKVTTAQTFPSGGGTAQSRVWNLLLVDRDVNTREGTMTLSLASDEALLDDAANNSATDDLSAFSVQSSLRSIVGLALAKIGATLAASPADNADATTYADSLNLFTDPRYQQTPGGGYGAGNLQIAEDTTFPGPQSGVAHKGIHLYNPTSSDSFLSMGVEQPLAFNVSPGEKYTLSATGSVRSTLTGTPQPNRARRLVVIAQENGVYYDLAVSPEVPTTVQTGTGGTRVSVTFTVPEGATQILLRAYHGYTGGTISWALFRLSKWSPDPADRGYFWGGKPAETGYAYAWSGAVDASSTRRTATIDRPPDSLVWRPGVSALEFIRPLVQVAGFRLVCDETRTWTLRGADYTAGGSLEFRQGVNIHEAGDSIDRRMGSWFDAAVIRYRWLDSAGKQRERYDYYGLSSSPTKTVRIEKETPYPGPGLAQYLVRRAQTVGRELTITAASDFMAKAEQPLTAYLDMTPAQIGKSSRVAFDFGRHQMTVTTRSVDTPAGAIDLKSGTINSLVGTINAQ